MSGINFSDGKFFLVTDAQSELLLDAHNPAMNRSKIYSHLFDRAGNDMRPLEQMVAMTTKKIFRDTPESLAEAVICTRIIARLLRKEQIHTVLRIGQPSPLDDALEQILPLFNPANKIFFLRELQPYLLPEKKFDTIIFGKSNAPIIFGEQELPPLEVMLAARNSGKIFFAAQIDALTEPPKLPVKIFSLTENFVLFETEMSAPLRRELRRLTPKGQLDEKFSAIIQVVDKLPAVLKKFRALDGKKKFKLLDDYLAEVIRAEKILAEIFPALIGDTIKFNFNLLKEFLIDLRLGNGTPARVLRQGEIVAADLSVEEEE